MSQLEELFTKYGTDKGIWGYTPAYETHLKHRRNTIRNVLEIGICGFRDIPNNVVGASLFAWKDYFPNAEIFGIDNDSRFVFHDQYRIHTALADAYDTASLTDALDGFDGHHLDQDHQYDFICDDAVHDPPPQLQLVRSLWPLLAAGGIYAIEEACPYKVPDNDLGTHMIEPLMREFEDMTAVEYSTHKSERLVILKKR